MDIESKKVLVVGASGVLGKQISSSLQSRGAQVFGTASTIASSSRLASDLHERLILDLEDSASISAVAHYLAEKYDSIDGVIFASGLVAFGSIEETPSTVFERLMKVNTSGPIHLTQSILANLNKSASLGNEPFLLTISGVISEAPMAGLAAYSASKAALAGFIKAASKELRKSGIRVLDARPGHTETGLATRAIFGTAPMFGSGKSPQRVAQRIVDAIMNDEKDLPSSDF